MLLLRMALAVCPSTIAVSVSVHRAWEGQAAAVDPTLFLKGYWWRVGAELGRRSK